MWLRLAFATAQITVHWKFQSRSTAKLSCDWTSTSVVASYFCHDNSSIIRHTVIQYLPTEPNRRNITTTQRSLTFHWSLDFTCMQLKVCVLVYVIVYAHTVRLMFTLMPRYICGALSPSLSIQGWILHDLLNAKSLELMSLEEALLGEVRQHVFITCHDACFLLTTRKNIYDCIKTEAA